jgi:hypothetical protein
MKVCDPTNSTRCALGFVDQFAGLARGLHHRLSSQGACRPQNGHAKFEVGPDGVAIAMASIDESASRSWKLVVVFTAGWRRWTIASFAVSRSETAATVVPGVSAKFRTRLGPQ